MTALNANSICYGGAGDIHLVAAHTTGESSLQVSNKGGIGYGYELRL